MGPARGFTLPELTVVLFIMGVILSVVLPRFGSMDDEEPLRRAARLMAGLALEAHSMSLTQSRPWYLCLDLDERRCWLSSTRPERDGGPGAESKVRRLPDGAVFQDAVLADRGLLKKGVVALAYWPQGGNEPGTVHLKAERGKEEMTVFFRPYVGRTEIETGYLREETR
ncbi:MAG: prepilin-type N-terminal cleavage/methylation domain-containing protein [Proteobacteria bacterium]|nr:prepilin-type N-terminal cleavage/methylation domain-containing protein [Pseudomonadota bacterium]